jgi:hypothetical protein
MGNYACIISFSFLFFLEINSLYLVDTQQYK